MKDSFVWSRQQLTSRTPTRRKRRVSSTSAVWIESRRQSATVSNSVVNAVQVCVDYVTTRKATCYAEAAGMILPHAVNCVRLCFWRLWQIHTEDVFDPSLGRVWLSRSKVKRQGHQRCFSSPLTMHASRTPYAANNVIQQQVGPFRRSRGREVTGVHADGGLRAVYVW